ncbi:hypothetical protein BKA69DRAFT_73074 [Paraphysoderma sedebokerense]|nr:hypothetical protein BKA69DRAFT_73074 [Paraphysoderma sedebokerense]
MECTTSLCSTLLNYVVPVAGNITAITVTLSPMKTVMNVRKSKQLSGVNPIPFAFIYTNALVWVVYGYFLKDYFIITPNLIGLSAGLFYTHSTYSLSSPRTRTILDLIMHAFTFTILLCGSISFISLPTETGKLLLGSLSIVILTLFYSSPLTTLYQVITTKNSVYFFLPLSITCLLNGMFWTVYGMVISNPFVWGPNSVGAGFALVQILCRIIFPSRELFPGEREAEVDVNEDGNRRDIEGGLIGRRPLSRSMSPEDGLSPAVSPIRTEKQSLLIKPGEKDLILTFNDLSDKEEKRERGATMNW